VVGRIPAGLPAPAVPDLSPGDLRVLLLPAFTVFVVGFSDLVLTGRAFARRGEQISANRELIALGAANAAVSMLRGFPVSSSGSRTAIAAAGSRTQFYSVTAAVVVAVVTLARPLLAAFPEAALAAIVIYAATRLIDVQASHKLVAPRPPPAA
jgi:sulfate permease, SulP family